MSCNKQAEAIFGLQGDEVLGKSDSDFFPDDQSAFFKAKYMEPIRTGKLVHIAEEAFGSPAISTVFVKTWKIPIAGGYLLGISQDITEIKQLEDEFEKERVAAVQSSIIASLMKISSGIAHEINNPLGIIVGYLQLFEAALNSG